MQRRIIVSGRGDTWFPSSLKQICILLLLGTGFFPSTALAQFASGTGTIVDPFLISGPFHLRNLSLAPQYWGNHFLLTEDIDLQGFPENFILPIGNASSPFTGTFKGNKHIISNLTIRITGQDDIGLFGVIDSANALIIQLGLISSIVDGVGTLSEDNVGLLAGRLEQGVISQCFVRQGSIIGDDFIGGLVGRNTSGTISDCYVAADPIGDTLIGGIAGYNAGMITRCYSTSTPRVFPNRESLVGGIVGEQAATGVISATFWDVDVSGVFNMCSQTRSGQIGCDNFFGKTTVAMQTEGMYLLEGWDFILESTNGTLDIWAICEGFDYPRLSWEIGVNQPCQQIVLFVDDNAANDPGPQDPLISDPNEDGSQDHPFDAIQKAIDVAFANSEIIVRDGTYTGLGNRNLSLSVPSIFLHSENGPTTCTIDLESNARGFVLTGNIGANSVIEGFTIINGWLAAPDTGAGLKIVYSDPIIRNCILMDNNGACGSDLQLIGSQAEFEDVTISRTTPSQNIDIAFSRINLQGFFNLTNTSMDWYQSTINGVGTINIDGQSTITVKSKPGCSPETIDRLSSGQLGSTPIFNNSEWFIQEAAFSNAVVFGASTAWYIAPDTLSVPAKLQWTGNPLLEDQSDLNGRAIGKFDAGGVILITGKIFSDPFNANSLLYDGILLQAQVGEFRVRESSLQPNQLEFTLAPVITPTGGFLASNALSFTLNGPQLLSLMFGAIQASGGGDLINFQEPLLSVSDSTISSQPEPGVFAETVLTTNIEGPGNIEIEKGAQLTLAGISQIDLGINQEQGLITVKGKLIVTDQATLKNSVVEIRSANLGTGTILENNTLTLLDLINSGGEFFVDSQASVLNNTIISQGDRYLDLDPDPNLSPSPTIENNSITVIINPTSNSQQGALLELRSGDFDCGIAIGQASCHSGAFQVDPNSQGFFNGPTLNNWPLEKLVLKENAKLNLTNRQGFEFVDPSFPNLLSSVEALYVKDLVMESNSTLNTALQNIYYQRLLDENGIEMMKDPDDPFDILPNGARFENIPLLGFSLVNIAMDDNTPAPNNEFDIRVTKRLQDINDEQLPPPALIKEGSITRIEEDPEMAVPIPIGSGGVMDMRTSTLQTASASSVAAKGSFARAGEEKITVVFEYMFIEDNGTDTELVVYLSDHPDTGKNIRELARIKPPAQGRPGAVGSNRFGLFSGTFTRGSLNFRRGTYVELELRGENSRIWIDNWDPKILCTTEVCGDFNGDFVNTFLDQIILAAEFGSFSTISTRSCVDRYRDGYIDTNDMFNSNPFNCNPVQAVSGSPTTANAKPLNTIAMSSPPVFLESLVVSGKSTFNDTCVEGGFSFFGNYLYNLDEAGSCSTVIAMPATNIESCDDPWGRLAVDGEGDLYQIHGTLGLIDIQTGDVILRHESNLGFGGDVEVSVGSFIGQSASSSLLDIAFDPLDPNIAYITPVSVHSLTSACGASFQAAAKVQLNRDAQGTYSILDIYSELPSSGLTDCNAVVDFLYEPHFQNPIEIEIGLNRKLYVLSANSSSENNWLLIYDTTQQTPQAEIISLNDPDLFGPSSLLVSKRNNGVYLTPSAVQSVDPNDLVTRIANFDIDFANQQISNLSFIDVQTPDPNRAFCNEIYNGCQNSGVTVRITSMTENPSNGTIYATGFTAPRLTEDLLISQSIASGISRLHTTAFIAEIVLDNLQAIAIPIAGCSTADPVALPLSIVWAQPLPTACKSVADISGDCQVNILDFSKIAAHWMTSNPVADIAPQPTPDGFVDPKDLMMLEQHWLLDTP